MVSKSKISEVRKLHQKKFRDQERLFLVEGRKSLEMLLLSDYEIAEIFATENCYRENQNLLRSQTVTLAESADMERMTALNTSPDLLAVVKQPSRILSLDMDAPLLVLDRIADPGNMGTMIRTADWFGIRQIVCSPDCVELYNPKTIQSTMGSFCHVSVFTAELPVFLKEQSATRRVLGTFLGGEPVHTFSFKSNDAIVIGSESHGISDAVAACITHRITIARGQTSGPSAESLNAAIAAAIVMDHWSSFKL